MIKKANQTLNLVTAAMEEDQGVRFKQIYFDLVAKGKRPELRKADGRSARVGPSVVSSPCDRRIWLKFRWGIVEALTAKAIRIFQRGYIEEPRIIAALLLAGLDVTTEDADGKPYRFRAMRDCYGGFLDAMVSKLPETGKPAVVELKTANERNFQNLVALGVEKAQPSHYFQMQQYMGQQGVRHALYIAVNKNTEEWWAEVVEFDVERYGADFERVDRILMMNAMPERVTDMDACRWCENNRYCWGSRSLDVSCRTCRYVTLSEGNWYCTNREDPTAAVLTLSEQKKGCEDYNQLDQINL